MRRILAMIAAPVVLATAACGSSGGGGGTSGGSVSSVLSSISKQSNLASELPSSVTAKGSITVASDATYAPNEYLDPVHWFGRPQPPLCKRCRSLIGAPEGSRAVRTRHASSPTFCHSA